MKVLNVIMSLDPINGGGSVERTFQLSRFLARSGIDCTILTTDTGLAQERIKELEGVNVVALKTLSKRFYLPSIAFRKIANIVKGVDIIHLMTHWTFLNLLVYVIARFLKKPYVVCPAGALRIYGRSKSIKRIYNWFAGYRIIRNASGCIAISSREIDDFDSYGVKNKDKIVAIPNGIDTGSVQPVDANGFREKVGIGKAPFVLFVGRLNSIKGPDLLLEAFRNVVSDRFPQHHLIFAGPDGGMLPELEQTVVRSGLEDKVHFIGYIDGVDKSSAYCEADLLVIPSRQEAMSIVVLEAGIVGTPVLITDQCGFDVVGEVNGGRVVAATSKGLQDGLVELLDQPDNLNKMGKNLCKYLCENFSWEEMAARHITFFRSLLEDHR